MRPSAANLIVVATTGYVGGLLGVVLGFDRPLASVAAVAVAVAGREESSPLHPASNLLTAPGRALVRVIESVEPGSPRKTMQDRGAHVVIDAEVIG